MQRVNIANDIQLRRRIRNLPQQKREVIRLGRNDVVMRFAKPLQIDFVCRHPRLPEKFFCIP
jgi:hypothetical protein